MPDMAEQQFEFGKKLLAEPLLAFLDEEKDPPVPRLVALDQQIVTLTRMATNDGQTRRGKHLISEKMHSDMAQRAQALRILRHFLDRSAPELHEDVLKLFSSQEPLLDTAPHWAFVMSVDIRRSTELMLKARSAQLFAAFISDLAARLMDLVKSHGGILDKFTGDGLLAFFLPSMSKPRSKFWEDLPAKMRCGFTVLEAAKACHTAFGQVYDAHAQSFSAVVARAGLGVGIDYGRMHTAQISGTPTIIGKPVVYACRLSSGPPGSTYLNIGAKAAFLTNAPLKQIVADVKGEEGGIKAWLAPEDREAE